MSRMEIGSWLNCMANRGSYYSIGMPSAVCVCDGMEEFTIVEVIDGDVRIPGTLFHTRVVGTDDKLSSFLIADGRELKDLI